MNVLPIGTRVWVAQAACPAIGRRDVSGDGIVTGHVPCSPCWQRYVGSGRHVTRAGYRAAAESCTEPSGFVVSLGRLPIAVTDGDPTVIAVPITSEERSAA